MDGKTGGLRSASSTKRGGAAIVGAPKGTSEPQRTIDGGGLCPRPDRRGGNPAGQEENPLGIIFLLTEGERAKNRLAGYPPFRGTPLWAFQILDPQGQSRLQPVQGVSRLRYLNQE